MPNTPDTPSLPIDAFSVIPGMIVQIPGNDVMLVTKVEWDNDNELVELRGFAAPHVAGQRATRFSRELTYADVVRFFGTYVNLPQASDNNLHPATVDDLSDHLDKPEAWGLDG